MADIYSVETKVLTKNYGSFKALDGITIELEPNKIYGLLGRNGAGKTTLLNILASRIFATSGEAKIFGKSSYENIDILKKICFIEEKGFYADSIKVFQVLDLAAGLYPGWDAEYAKKLVDMFELDTKKKYKQLSRGMETSLGLIIGLASRAELTIFDEPSLGLDAVVRERFYDAIIDDFAQNPRTIILSTHLIDEVSRIFEDIVIIDNGRLLMKSNAVELKEQGFYISGKEDAVRAAAGGSIIMGEERFGSTLILSVFAKDGLKNREGVEIQPIPLQKLFVNLINPEIHDMMKKGGVFQ